MEEKEVILTQEGFDNLEKELNYLRTEKRAEIADRIKVALGFGDLSENSEYDEAKTAQAENEVKILRCATIRCWGECVNLKYRFFGIDFVNIITMIKTNCNTKYT